MKRPHRPLLVLHRDRVFCETLRKASGSQYSFRVLPTWEALLEAVASASAASVLVVDPYLGADPKEVFARDLSTLMYRFPSATVVAALEFRPGRLEQVRRLGEFGVAQIICLDEENTHHAVRERLRLARGRPLRNLLVSVLPTEMNGMARSILVAAVMVVTEGGQTKDLARVVSVTPRTLLRWCRKAGLPPPKQLLAWLRMMLAAELLDDPGRAVLDVALACGYAADSSMRHAMRNFLATSPTALRERGAFQTAAQAFVAALHDARITERRYRRDHSAQVVPAHRQGVPG